MAFSATSSSIILLETSAAALFTGEIVASAIAGSLGGLIHLIIISVSEMEWGAMAYGAFASLSLGITGAVAANFIAGIYSVAAREGRNSKTHRRVMKALALSFTVLSLLPASLIGGWMGILGTMLVLFLLFEGTYGIRGFFGRGGPREGAFDDQLDISLMLYLSLSISVWIVATTIALFADKSPSVDPYSFILIDTAAIVWILTEWYSLRLIRNAKIGEALIMASPEDDNDDDDSRNDEATVVDAV